MKHSMKLALILALLAAFGCKNDDDGDDTDTTQGNLQPEVEGALGKANRPVPVAADRIDRAGRPAVTAALISTFDGPEKASADRDRYNKSGNANPDFIPIIEKSLAILDGLDGTCENQLLAGTGNGNIYRALATALDDDQLYVQSDRVSSSPVYLGVEAEATDAVPAGAGSGGGRGPGDDVIETSYSVLVAGKLTGIDDGVKDDDATHSIDVFPFIAEAR
jgi:hypothetical protein